MNISLIGTGHVATLLAAAWAAAGHTVAFGSRDPQAKAGQLDYPVVSIAEAVASADVVVNATPGARSVEILTGIGAEAYAEKVLLDVANAATETLDPVYPGSSLGQALQDALPEAKVVKSLNTAAMNVIVNPSSIGESSLFVSGDHAEAKATVTSLIVDLGWNADDVVDLGGIETAKGAEYYFQLFFAIMGAVKNPQFNIKLVR